MIGLLKRIVDSMVKVGVVFCTNFRRDYFQWIKNSPGQSPSLPISYWSLSSAGLYCVHGCLSMPSHSSTLGNRRCWSCELVEVVREGGRKRGNLRTEWKEGYKALSKYSNEQSYESFQYIALIFKSNQLNEWIAWKQPSESANTGCLLQFFPCSSPELSLSLIATTDCSSNAFPRLPPSHRQCRSRCQYRAQLATAPPSWIVLP